MRRRNMNNNQLSPTPARVERLSLSVNSHENQPGRILDTGWLQQHSRRGRCFKLDLQPVFAVESRVFSFSIVKLFV